jgi:hypothetical protein
MIGEQRIGKGLEGNGYVVLEVLSQHLPRGIEDNDE